ncbi:MAG: DNA repair protein RadC [Actinobacteria bacterium]|nr:DNA repair protein RadC [Actinomycetota bacterium]
MDSEKVPRNGEGKIKYIQKLSLSVLRENTATRYQEISGPEDVYKLPFVQELAFLDRESFICIHLNTKHRAISYEVVSIGSLNSSVVHPREIFKGAILANAAAVILCHNHPSGDPTPSVEDVVVTGRIRDAGKIVGIEVLDHIVVGEKSFASLKEQEWM